MKKFRKLIPALALLLVSAVLMSTASYAWFSMNNKVTVTGMEVKTKTSSNLYVQTIAADATGLPAEAGYKAAETQTIKGFLEPVSTISANSSAFFYHTTQTVSAEGKPTESGAVYIDYDVEGTAASSSSGVWSDKFSENYDVTKTDASGFGDKAVAYVDYVVILKAVNVGAASKILLNHANLIYTGKGNLEAKSYRLAFFTEKWDGSAFGALTSEGIIAPNGADNFESGKAVSSTTELGSVSYTGNIEWDVAANTTEYYRVTARLYLEGEDDTCNNETFMLLTGNWSLDLAFELATSGSGANTITQYSKATVSTKDYYYDGTYVWDNYASIGTESDRVARDSAAADVKTELGIPTP